MADIGRKDDSEKPRVGLLLSAWPALVSVVRVLEHGAEKYGANNWLSVNRGEERYTDAALRHLGAYGHSEDVDPESGLPHLAHAACSLIFALSFYLRRQGCDVRKK